MAVSTVCQNCCCDQMNETVTKLKDELVKLAYALTEKETLFSSSFFVDCLKTKTISAVCYEEHNNELVLADKELARCLGQGTDVFKQRIPSHDQPLWDVIYNSQFKQLVSLSLDACIRVWDILTGEFLLEFSALSNVFMKPVAIMFDPTNRKLLALSKDKEIAYWNFNNGKEIEVLPLKVPNHVTGLIQERDTLFISALNCKTIFALDLQNGNHKYLQHPLLKDTCAMELHKDTLITISSDGNAVLVLADKELARCLGQGTDVFKQRIPSHDQPLWDVIYNSQFKQLVSLSLDACIRVWDILTGEFLLEFSALSNVFMKPVAIMFDPTNRKLLVLSKDKEIAYWNFNNGKKIEVLPLKVPNHVTGLIQERDTLFISTLPNTNIHTHTLNRTHSHLHTFIHAHTYTYTLTHTHTHSPTLTHKHTH
uniref:Uncharacterized protein n=1 Tax=Oryzias latipes TaxID=8090 RepID=A0A3B3IDH0_ORYLA